MKISIITTSLNSAGTIEGTIKSVLSQSYPDIEYIIIDGGSTDGTIEIVKKYGDRIAKFISEPDNGMYDAMNKGIRLATGDIIGILNSDDIYADSGVLATVAGEFERTKTACIWGDLVYVKGDNSNTPWRTWKSSPYQKGAFRKGWHPPHPAFFVKKEIYDKHGLFRTDLSTAGDFELMLRFLEKCQISSSYLSYTLVRMRAGGQSNKNIYNRLRAIWHSYRSFGINGLKIDPLFILRKPLFKLNQFR